MSLIQMSFFSEALNMFTPVNIALPLPRDAAAEARDLPALILLHGMGDDSSAWLRKTAIERYALEVGLAVVMPDGELSCYENMAHGGCYRDYVSQELPRVMRETFPLSADREKNFIAGCSMGGFGALKLGLACPEQWSAIGCFSAAHMEYRPDSPRVRATLERVYGGAIDACDARIEDDIQAVNASGPEVRVWHACGDADALRENALLTRARFEALPSGSIRYHFEMLPGRHDWALWDAMAARFLPWLGLPKPEARLL